MPLDPHQFVSKLFEHYSSDNYSNNESSEILDIIKPGRRVKLKGYSLTGSKMSIISDDSLFATGAV